VTEASMTDLRHHGGEIVDRAAAGERIVITRSGKPVAELVPGRQHPLTPEELLERWHKLPSIDYAALRADLDSIVDPSL
jgi:prevent-host-death family protein